MNRKLGLAFDKRIKYPITLKDDILREYEKGELSIGAIARDFGVSESYARKIVKPQDFTKSSSWRPDPEKARAASQRHRDYIK